MKRVNIKMVICEEAGNFNLLQCNLLSSGTSEAEVSSVIQIEGMVGGRKVLRKCRFFVWVSGPTLIDMLLQPNAELPHSLPGVRRGTVRAEKTIDITSLHRGLDSSACGNVPSL